MKICPKCNKSTGRVWYEYDRIKPDPARVVRNICRNLKCRVEKRKIGYAYWEPFSWDEESTN